MIRIPIVALLLSAILSAGCSHNALPRHPNAINEFDGRTYDGLVVAQAVLDAAKIEVAKGVLPASVKPVINSAGKAYNEARELWLLYRAQPDASIEQQIVAAMLELNRFILELRGLGVKE